MTRDGGGLSPARLGEAWAHLAFFQGSPRAAVLGRLGYEEAAFEREATELRGELARGLERGELAAVLSFSRAYDLTARQLRSRRPRLEAIAPNPGLEPLGGERRIVAPREIVPLPKPAADASATTSSGAHDLPSYLRADLASPSAPEPPAPAAPSIAAQPAAATPPESPVRAPSPLAVTAPPVAKKAGTLPFMPTPTPDAPARPAQPRAAHAEEHVDTGTEFLSDDGPSLDGDERLKPFASLVRYAELVASLRAHPEQAEATLKASGLATADDRNKVHGHWLARFESDAETKQRFDRLCEAMQRKARP